MFFYLAMINEPEQRGKFEEIYFKYKKTMVYEARLILKDDYSAEDAVHKAFEKVLKNMHKINEINSHKTKNFLVIIVRNIAIDMYNEDRKHKTLPLDEIIDIEDASQLSVQETVLSSDNYERMIEFVTDKLPSIYRDAFLLKYAYGYDNADIAQILSIKEENVRKRLQVARQRLVKLIGTGGDC